MNCEEFVVNELQETRQNLDECEKQLIETKNQLEAFRQFLLIIRDRLIIFENEIEFKSISKDTESELFNLFITNFGINNSDNQ